MIEIPILKKENLNLYQVLKEPGTYIVKVANTVKPQHLFTHDGYPRYIVNLRVATEENFKKCLKILGKDESCEFSEVKDCFMSGALWERDLQDISQLPTKGENIIATFDYVDDILRCVSLTLLPRKALNNFDLNAYNEIKKMYNEILNKL